jgi:uncharacterized membrane protein YcfT
MAQARVAWADLAKGLTIVLVVFGHAVDGVNTAVPLEPWLFDALKLPFGQFRMPLFFFVTGLFAAGSVRRAWPEFADRTLLPLVWVFLVWNVLQYAARMTFAGFANHPADPLEILYFSVQPINVTWFLWALILLYALLRVGRDMPPALLAALTASLAATTLPIDHYALEQTSHFAVYFVLGYALAPVMRAWQARPEGRVVLLWLAGYGALCVLLLAGHVREVPVLDLAVRCYGIGLVILGCAWTASRVRLGWLVGVGRYTLPIFVMHTIFTAGARETLLRLGITAEPMLLILAATLAGLVLPLLLHAAARRVGAPWLFQRPAWFRLPAARPATAAAEG